MDNINNYIETNKERFLNELSELLKIPSISADSKYESDVLNAASYVKESLDKAGCQITEIIETTVFLLFMEKLQLILKPQLYLFTVIMTFSQQTLLNYGVILHLNP